MMKFQLHLRELFILAATKIHVRSGADDGTVNVHQSFRIGALIRKGTRIGRRALNRIIYGSIYDTLQ